MIRIMIVDDEAVIRRGIKTSIDWKAYGGEVIGEARNGKQALEMVQTLQPDIILTDIRMPVMDGLAFSEAVRKENQQVKIVILTGYDDFEYAKRAIRLRVEDFLLKPVGAEELIRLFQKLKSQIEEERQKKQEFQQREQLVREHLPLLHADFVKRLIRQQITGREAKNLAEDFGLSVNGPFYAVAMVEIDDFYRKEPTAADEAHAAVYREAAELLQRDHHFLAEWKPGQFVGFFNLEPEHGTQKLIRICKRIQERVKERLKETVTVAIGQRYPELEQIAVSYQEAKAALEKKIYQGKNTLLVYEEQSHQYHDRSGFESDLYSEETEQALVEAVQLLDEKKVEMLTEKVFSLFKQRAALFSEVKAVCIRLLLSVEKALSKMGVELSQRIGFDEMNDYKTIEDIHRWFKDKCLYFLHATEEAKTSKYRYVVKTTMEYVQKHYDQPITLETISNLVYITPNYFSRIFKEETGQTFVDWLNSYRVEKAKLLLKQDRKAKTAEIAERVGYNDYKYFSYIFKKYTGYSPRAFRDL